jgi:hypothetical protein
MWKIKLSKSFLMTTKVSTFALSENFRQSNMNLSELANNLLTSDKKLVAARHGVSEDYIYRLLNGTRATNSETSKQIMTDLEFLASLNISQQVFKTTELGPICEPQNTAA